MTLLIKKDFCKNILIRSICSQSQTCTSSISDKEFKYHRRHYSVENKPNAYSTNHGEREPEKKNDISGMLNYLKDGRLLYNCFVQSRKLNVPHYVKKMIQSKIVNDKKRAVFKSSVPVIVEHLQSQKEKFPNDIVKEMETQNQVLDTRTSFPFSKFHNINLVNLSSKNTESLFFEPQTSKKVSIKEDVAVRLTAYNTKSKEVTAFSQTEKHKPMDKSEVRIYKDTLLSPLTKDETNHQGVTCYGKPNPIIPKSDVPCGGCGEVLHCQDEGLPGYIPSELFSGKDRGELKRTVCQRCFFLKRFKTALNVRISPDLYEKALIPITESKAMVMVIVDLLDVPCSIWPGLFDLIGTRRPVVVVGNKMDLLPLDNKDYLDTIQASLVQCIKETSLWKTNIRHICLVSAKTGYGVEDLITHIQVNWGVTDDIYMIGCTNAGKSSLFNALLGSDLCQVEASSLIQRATASPWPGTTLNLLKFPLLHPSGKRLFDRMRRMSEEPRKRRVEASLAALKNPGKQPVRTLSGQIGQTFNTNTPFEEVFDPFKVTTNKIVRDSLVTGINDKKPKYANSKWCYDTPGTVQPDQLLSLLTHDELMDVLPRETIQPRTFCVHNSQSLFIGGLARLDLLYTSTAVRVTVCCSSKLPVTIVSTCEASSVHRSYLGSDLFRVPRGTEDRLSQWPPLKPVDIRLEGRGRKSSADVVLSSAGFITICADERKEIELRGWTPGGRGVYVRIPSMLPFAFKIRGKKIRGTPKFYSRQMSFENQD